MNTLLLRLIGPMQAWGVQSQHKDRDTGLEPSKSGVIGLLGAALGIDRADSERELPRLAALRMGVRVDREGQRRYDFHTALDIYKADDTPPPHPKNPRFSSVSKRWYLADAAFLAGLESEDVGLLENLHNALRRPYWPLYLGRKAFVPSAPVYLKDGLRRAESLEQALREFPWLGRQRDARRVPHLRAVIEDDSGPIVRSDDPISFALFERQYAPRRVSVNPDWTLPSHRLEVGDVPVPLDS